MRYLLMMSALLCLSGCGQNGGTVDDGGSMSNEPQVIIETGYLRCAPAADECDGALTCTTEADESVCVEAEAEECVGEASCACEGAWVCGDRACADVDGGFECGTSPNVDDVCTPADCGEPISGGLCGNGQPYDVTCERNDGGSCEWVVGECQEPLPECQVEDCGEPVSGGLCDDGQPYEITCERNDGGSCEWVVGECQEPPPECQVEDCGEQISGGLCESGQPYEITCERNDGGSCEWVVGECQEPTADRQLTVNACPPVEGANDPYEMRSIERQGDTLYVGVEYGGGCEEHGFLACPSDFRGPNPLQMTVSLSHDSNGDACEALMSELIAIDLTWIKEQHQAQFNGAEREVNITIQGPNGGESFLYSY